MNRNRTRIFGSALVATALTLSAAGTALADPVISTSVGSIPTEGSINDSFDILAQGCVNPGGDAYFGGFVIDTNYPEAPFAGFQELTTDGTWEWPVLISPDAQLGSYEAHAYCSSGPVSSIDDPNMLWVSPAYQFTIMESDAGMQSAMKSAMKSLATSARTSSAPDQEFLTVDKESAPLVDRMGISGERAAQLKAKVDAKSDVISELNRLTQVFGDRSATAAELKANLASIDSGKKTLATVANGFTSLKDFATATKGQNNPEKIARLYRNAFGTEAPTFYVNLLVGEIKAKHITLAQIGRDFANSSSLVERPDDSNYVTAAYFVLGNRVPTAGQLAEQVSLLQDTLAPRVQVVENVALQVGAK